MTDPINSLTPGQPMTEEQRKALADSNLRETNEANRLAAEQRQRDAQEGRGEPAVSAVAGMLKRKLVDGDIHSPEEGTRSKTV
jgi:hypothetical protein